MADLAIKGHPTRGKEVIEILKMLGGKMLSCLMRGEIIPSNVHGNDPLKGYYIDAGGHIDQKSYSCFDDTATVFTLKKFLEKYPYKVGDKVCIPEYETKVRIDDMKWDGFEIQYSVFTDEIEWYSAEELNKYNESYKEETMKETNKAIFEGNAHCCDIMNDIIKDNIEERKYAELRMPLDDDDKLSTEVTIDGNKILPPENYLIGKVTQVDNGMLVEFVKKQPNYPKTYVECCKILEINSHNFLRIKNFYQNEGDEETAYYEKDLLDKFNCLWTLRICRDAYWKIAGEQMGLGKPWESDLENKELYCIQNYNNQIIKSKTATAFNKILIFPTEEMRDAFYENFYDFIEECIELL